MQKYSAQKMADLAMVFDGLGHPRRIAIFHALRTAGSDGLSFGALAKQANIADPSLTHHIRMMKKSGLVKSRIQGQFTMLSLDLTAMKHALKQLNLN